MLSSSLNSMSVSFSILKKNFHGKIADFSLPEGSVIRWYPFIK